MRERGRFAILQYANRSMLSERSETAKQMLCCWIVTLFLTSGLNPGSFAPSA